MERDNIIKALECCTSGRPCRECDFKDKSKDTFGCRKQLLIDALSLIKELTEENESLKAQRRVLAVGLKDFRKEIKAIKADTVRKMQERLRNQSEFIWYADEDRALYYVDLQEWVDQIAKEMLEGEK